MKVDEFWLTSKVAFVSMVHVGLNCALVDCYLLGNSYAFRVLYRVQTVN